MGSTRFGLVVIAICGVLALAAGIQVGLWQDRVAVLSEGQEAVSGEILQLRNALDALVDSETGQRGYLLTGQEAYLQPYDNGRAKFSQAVEWLTAHFRGDAAILDQIEAVAKLGQAKEAELARTVALRRAGDLGGALAIVRAGEGKRLMESFREKADQLIRQRGEARSALAAEEADIFARMSALGAIVFVLILALVAVAIRWLSVSIRRLDDLQLQREREAMHDALTALPNRRYLNDWMKMTLAAARRGRQRVVVLYFDLDGFKPVNDRFGHEAGDRVLQVVAQRLRGAVRAEDFVARLGGDEFVAVLPDAPGQPELSMLIARLARDLAKAPIAELADGDVSASIGVACYPEDGDDADTLLGVADRAMYGIKERRKRNAAPPSEVRPLPGLPAAT